MSRAMPLLSKLLSSLLAACVIHFIELGDVVTTEGHKPLRQLGRRGEFRSLRKQVAEEQPGFSID